MKERESKVQKVWLFLCADNYLGILSQEEQLKEYCQQNEIEILGETLAVHFGMQDTNTILMAMRNAVEKECDYVLTCCYSSLRYGPEVYMELLSQYLEFGVSIYAMDCGDVFKQAYDSMPDYLKKRLG